MPRNKCICSPCSERATLPWTKFAGMVWKRRLNSAVREEAQARKKTGRCISNPRHNFRRRMMRYVDEFRDPELITKAAEEIRRLAEPERHYRIMEVCGGHTHAIYRFGLKDILPDNIELIHGPGCPVCVLPMGRIDDGLDIARKNDVIFAAFGDMMRVPGAHGSPFEHKARGTDVRIVYSPADALQIARRNPDRHVIFFAIGFETTAHSTALTLMRAKG